MSRYRTFRMRNGAIAQSGLDRRHGHHTADPMQPKLGLYRGLVLQTYVPQLNDGADNENNFRKFQVECDVILVASQIQLRQVPVQQSQYGVNNASPIIPRAATRVLSGNAALNFDVVSRRGQFNAAATAFDNTDGDFVVVEFVEGMIDYPIITGMLTHERTNRIIREGAGWDEGSAGSERGIPEQDEDYRHHQGTEVRVSASGDYLVDTVGAYSDGATEAATADTGQVRFRLKDNLKFTVECDGTDVLEVFKDGTGVHVHLGEGATESLLKGDAFKTLYNAHTHTSPVGGSTGTPVVQMELVPGTHLSQQHKVGG